MHGNEPSNVKFPNLYLKQIYDVQETCTQEFNSILLTMLKYYPFFCDATLGKPNRSFEAFSDYILKLFIRIFKTPFE